MMEVDDPPLDGSGDDPNRTDGAPVAPGAPAPLATPSEPTAPAPPAPAPIDNDDDLDRDDRSTAAAAAQVAAMAPPPVPPTQAAMDAAERNPRGGGRGRGGGNDAALTDGDGNPNFELLDEGAELVREKFLEFLCSYREALPDVNIVHEEEDGDGDGGGHHHHRRHVDARVEFLSQFSLRDGVDDEEAGGGGGGHGQGYYFPYLYQAYGIARHLLDSDEPDEGDDADDADAALLPHSPRHDKTTLFVDYGHLLNHDVELAEAIECELERFEPYLRRALKTFLLENYPDLSPWIPAPGGGGGGGGGQTPSSSSQQQLFFAVAFYNHPNLLAVRDLRMERVGRLSSFSATVTRTSDVRPELLSATFRCDRCGLLSPSVAQEYHHAKPQLCRNPRCDNNTSGRGWILEQGCSEFVDWQKLRVQENADEIPPGSMPRSVDVVVRNDMVESAKAGDKCVFVGCLVVIPDSNALSRTGDAVVSTKSNAAFGNGDTAGNRGVRGLKALGVRELTYRTCFVAHCVVPLSVSAAMGAAAAAGGSGEDDGGGGAAMHHVRVLDLLLASSTDASTSSADEHTSARQMALEFTEEERADLRRMRGTPQLYTALSNSVAPSVFGHPEVKRGVLLMLVGGVHKTTDEGMKLRGDVNVCIVGDPSTAKSQFLKYVHSFLPRAVYTSGKASSAAGLTASVQRDSDTGEYVVEAGALMLADRGVCCVDEFDKMDVVDQVAIHEAMEQQTISVTKAGIQATLNARASVLAAANPIYGRYDRSKTLKANVGLSAPILSRFDLFFVVLDECDELADYSVAKHILDVHRCIEGNTNGFQSPPFTKEQLQRYIRFARTLNPVITPESKKYLVECYKGLRQGDTLGRGRSAYRITVRQLESMIRLSEALARIHLDDQVRPAYVREASRLLRKSIIHVETEDVTFDDEDDDQDDDLGAGNEGDGTGALEGSDDNGGDDDDDGDDDDGAGGGASGQRQQRRRRRHAGEYDPTEHGARSGKAGVDENNTATNSDVAGTDSDPAAHAREGDESKSDGDNVDEHDRIDDGAEQQPRKKRKKKKKKTQITFEQYESIANALAVHLRSKEEEDPDDPRYLTWGQAVEWYLEQCEGQIGDSLEELDRLRRLTNLVLRRLIERDHVVIYMGGQEDGVAREDRLIAVHPNYVVS